MGTSQFWAACQDWLKGGRRREAGPACSLPGPRVGRTSSSAFSGDCKETACAEFVCFELTLNKHLLRAMHKSWHINHTGYRETIQDTSVNSSMELDLKPKV